MTPDRFAEFLDRLDTALAEDILDGVYSPAEVADALRAAGGDPEQIGRDGAALVRQLIEARR